MIRILGISAYYHDSAAALIIDGQIINAIQEERFSRIKHDNSFPEKSIQYIIKQNNLNLNDLDYIIFYEKPFLKFERLLETYLDNSPYGFSSFNQSMPIWSQEKLFQKQNLFKSLQTIDSNFSDISKIKFIEHHISHAASAFYPSPFNESLILTADGVGEWATTTVAIGKKNNIEMKKVINYPNSLGLLYSSFTYYCGFKVNDGEYKLMGLAPYGDPKYFNLILDNLIDVKDDGSFEVNQKYFDYSKSLKMINSNFIDLFGKGPRSISNENIEQFYMDVAASIQKVIEFVMLKICYHLQREYKLNNLCLAGGVALNCVANGKILKENIFKNIWIQPAAGDAGGALGAALYYYHEYVNGPDKNQKKDDKLFNDKMNGSYLGPEYSNDEIKNILDNIGAKYEYYEEDDLFEYVANLISEANAIGWFQGKMEFGPRALGNRSILADPRNDNMQRNLNLKIKYRESFRPFAPAVLFEEANNWFEINCPSPYMLLVSNINENKRVKQLPENLNQEGLEKLKIKRSVIPAVTHVDFSARVQTVKKSDNEKFYKLIHKFKEITGTPILVNTSFNVRDEPIVNTIEEAYSCFLKTDLDYLVCGNYLLKKSNQFVRNTCV